MHIKKRVAVFFGGQSSEHEVSRISAESIIKNIDRDKFDVSMVGISRNGRWVPYSGPIDNVGKGDWLNENSTEQGCFDLHIVPGCNTLKAIIDSCCGGEVDVIFPVLHGTNGEDGRIQGIFEMAGIPYVGSGVLGSALGMDKAYAKVVFGKESIPQGEYMVVTRKQVESVMGSLLAEIEGKFTYPCFVKPSNAGSSVGVSKAHDINELQAALKLAALYDGRILIEEFIDGREVECAVLGNDSPIASVVGEVVASNEFYDYQAKYIDNCSKTFIPAELPDDTAMKIREYAVKAFTALDCAGLSRVDFFVHKKTGQIFINEINTLPGFTSISMYPKLFEAYGIPYGKLIERLIELAFERFNSNKSKIEI